MQLENINYFTMVFFKSKAFFIDKNRHVFKHKAKERTQRYAPCLSITELFTCTVRINHFELEFACTKLRSLGESACRLYLSIESLIGTIFTNLPGFAMQKQKFSFSFCHFCFFYFLLIFPPSI